ncbi:MAG: phage tail protein [Pseudomonadota bacterium]|jgi:phage protein U
MANLYAVLGQTELEIVTWLSGLDMSWSASYAEQALIGHKALLQHTGFGPTEVRLRVLLHAQWCQPAEELARLKRLLEAAEPVAFVLGSGEYRGTFVVAELQAVTTQTDGAGVLIALEADATLREYIGDPAQPNPPGVIAQGLRIPVAARADTPAAPASPLSALARQVSAALAAGARVAQAASGLRSLAALAQRNPLAALAQVPQQAQRLNAAAAALPTAVLPALPRPGGLEAAAQVARSLGAAQQALHAAAQRLQGAQAADLGARLPQALALAQGAQAHTEAAAAPLALLAAQASARLDDAGSTA